MPCAAPGVDSNEGMMDMKTLSLIVTISLVVSSASAAGDGAVNPMGTAGTSTYEFDAHESTVTETGGFAGFHRVYSVRGQIQLTVDPNAGTASFRRVDAKATSYGPFAHDLDLNEVFDLSTLPGTILDDGSVRFEGNVYDGSSVLITLVFDGATIHLRGETVPPLQSADFFSYELNAAAQRKYAGGTGEPDDPYRIGTAEQMNAIGAEPNDWNKQFKLMADIDLAAFDGKAGRPTFRIVGTDYDGAFVGVFDGLGHTVHNFTFQPDGGHGVGLFGFIGQSAEVKNLVIQDANVAGEAYVGVLVGYSNGGTVRNCRATGYVQATQYTGGLIGICISGALTENCQSQVRVSGGFAETGGLVGANSGSTISQCSTAGAVEGSFETGGITGRQDGHSLIRDSYSACTISGGSRTAGIAGRNDGSLVSRCYSAGVFVSRSAGGRERSSLASYISSAGAVIDGDQAGGLVACSVDGEVEASFWDMQTSGLTTSAGGTGKTTVEMQTASTFLAAGWDFVGETTNGTEDIWWIEEGLEYPRLAWERMPSDDPAIEIRNTNVEIPKTQ